MSLSEGDYWAFLFAARARAARTLPDADLQAAGSLANGQLVAGLSDLDISVSVPAGRGPATRDSIPALARELGRALTVFVDPFSPIGTICSVYPGPLKVDWFIREGEPPDHVWIWSGAKEPPYDPDGHSWDWIWWIWGKLRRGHCELARSELSKLWQWLIRAGVPPTAFPPELPPANQARLEALAVLTLPHLPSRPSELAAEVSRAIRSTA